MNSNRKYSIWNWLQAFFKQIWNWNARLRFHDFETSFFIWYQMFSSFGDQITCSSENVCVGRAHLKYLMKESHLTVDAWPTKITTCFVKLRRRIGSDGNHRRSISSILVFVFEYIILEQFRFEEEQNHPDRKQEPHFLAIVLKIPEKIAVYEFKKKMKILGIRNMTINVFFLRFFGARIFLWLNSKCWALFCLYSAKKWIVEVKNGNNCRWIMQSKTSKKGRKS